MTTTISIARSFIAQIRRDAVLAVLGFRRTRRPRREAVPLPWPYGEQGDLAVLERELYYRYER